MKILVVGGTGHIGTFLVPKLVQLGHEVYIATRGRTKQRKKMLLLEQTLFFVMYLKKKVFYS
jgi:uncharacterized protein YbjT (DUF2867 family)